MLLVEKVIVRIEREGKGESEREIVQKYSQIVALFIIKRRDSHRSHYVGPGVQKSPTRGKRRRSIAKSSPKTAIGSDRNNDDFGVSNGLDAAAFMCNSLMFSIGKVC